MKVTKASGKQEEFSKKKFCKSLEDSGVPKALVDKTCDIVESEIEDGIETDKLFHRAREILLQENPILAGKYSLKRAIMELGPAGYLFEQYVAAILEEYNYKAKTNQMMQGKCVEHEIDVMAEKGSDHFIIEAKYHNKRGIKSDLQTVMYTHARFEDIKEYQEKEENNEFNHGIWLVTNTSVTSEGVKYGSCRNVKITCWDHPEGKSLKDMIDKKVLYPTTLLPAVNSFARKAFAEENIYFAKDLTHFSKNDFEKKFDIYPNVSEDIYNQAKALVDESQK